MSTTLASTPTHLLNSVGADSGLTPAHVRKLGWKYHDDASELHASFPPLAAIEMPTFNLQGKRSPTLRVRFVDPDTSELGFGKYATLRGGQIQVYFPPLLRKPKTWSKIAKDTTQDLLITEGEKKAASSTRAGFPCLGLQGVDCFTDPMTGKLHDDLAQIDWHGRKAFITYDSDVTDKKEVRAAMRRLAGLLFREGAEVYGVRLPGADGEKVGLDDYLVAGGDLASALQQAKELVPHRQLRDLDDQYVMVRSPACIRHINKPDRIFRLSNTDFEIIHNDPVTSTDPSTGKAISVPVGLLWKKHYPERPEVDSAGYFPNRPKIFEDKLNLWPGWGVEPKRGSTQVWQKLLRGVFGNRPKLIHWFEQWCAYPIQNPGAKMLTAVFIWGGGQGTGKSSIGEFLVRIYGADSGGQLLSDDALNDKYNGWLEHTGFATVDDLSAENPKLLRAHLKRLITAPTIPVRRMYQEHSAVENHCNFMFTSNSISSIPLDESGNRRFFVIQAPNKPEHPIEWYTQTMDRYLHTSGPSHVMYRLLHDIDCSKFNPRASAPETEDRTNAVAVSAPEIGVWLKEIVDDTAAWLDQRLLPADAEILSTQQLAGLASHDLKRNVSERQIGLHAVNAGLVKLGQMAPLPDKKRPTVWSIRNHAKYRGKDKLKKARGEYLRTFPVV